MPLAALLSLALILVLSSCGGVDVEEPLVTSVTNERLLAAGDEVHNWLSHGRTYDEQRFSPLDQISTDNVAELGLAWYYDIPTKRGIEATPIVVDGRMYVTGSWSIVYALDAATGRELWRYDPEVPHAWGSYTCCDVVNRGVAVWEDLVFVGTLDGYLVALDAESGAELWRVDTIARKPPYTITGAPRVVNGLVIIGNGGGEFGVRDYVTAYSARTGEQVWRFYTVPGDPAEGFENELLERAAETWTGEWWQFGGGGAVWDSMAYDPELDLLFVGVGNGSPHNQRIRSPGGGDNLFLSSIVALRPSSGEYVWHYQTTPGDSWDYTATQHMILADLEIAGETRKVLMQAPKNGFFYVLDRTNGEFISAENYVHVTWAHGIDPETGRPIETPDARYGNGPEMIMPSSFGGHNWQPMAFSPHTGLIYVPAQDLAYLFSDNPEFVFSPGKMNVGIDYQALESLEQGENLVQFAELLGSRLLAWDPIAQCEVWRFPHVGPASGGTLATGGGLVFQGNTIGEFAAFDAAEGDRLWRFDAQTAVHAAPASYSINKIQHVAVAVGWGTSVARKK